MSRYWIYVILTCVFELLWVYGFNVATHTSHWIVIILIIAADFYFLSKACEGIATGTVYAIFAGAGTVGSSLMDVFLFDGTFTVLKVVFIITILIGVTMLKLADNADTEVEQ